MTSRRVRAVLAWTAAVIVASAMLVATRYLSRDPDSEAYTGMSARLVDVPIRQWIAPQWRGVWDSEGLFRDNPAGVLILPAVLGRAGVPPLQAAHVIGAIASILAVVLLGSLAARVVRPEWVPAVQWAALLMPVWFVYRMRATQELPLLVLMLAALYAVDRSREKPAWIAGTIAAAIGVFLVKGAFVLFVPLVCGLWLWCIRRSIPGGNDRVAWGGLAAAVVATGVAAFGYEQAYRAVSGESFFDYYVWTQIASKAQPTSELANVGIRMAKNLTMYSAWLLWYAAPWSVVLIAVALRRGWSGIRIPPAVAFAVAVAGLYIGLMSLGHYRGARYIFPAYFAIGLTGCVVALHRSSRLQRVAQWIDRREPYGTPMLWLALYLGMMMLDPTPPPL